MAAHKTRKIQVVETPSQQDKEGKMGEKYKKPPNLPRDVLFNILSRVPATSVYDLRFVEKPWHDLICSDPAFIEAHLLRAKQDPGWIMQTSNPLEGRGMFDTYWVKLEAGRIIREKINITHDAMVTVLASCNGLLLLKKRSTLYVVNPITKQQMKLPPHGGRLSYDRYALAFIPSTGKYKVLYYFPGNAYGCMILTLGSNKWNQIEEPSESANLTFFVDNCHLSVNGIVHWKIVFLHKNRSSFILSTDANSEKFHLTNLPEKIPSTFSRQKDYPIASHLVEMRGYLAYLSVPDYYEMWIWILEDLYNGIWTRHQMIDLQHLRRISVITGVDGVFIRPIISLQEGRVIIFSEVRDVCIRYIALNVESNSCSFMNLDKNVRKGRWMPHVMSLVQPPVPELVKRTKASISTGK